MDWGINTRATVMPAIRSALTLFARSGSQFKKGRKRFNCICIYLLPKKQFVVINKTKRYHAESGALAGSCPSAGNTSHPLDLRKVSRLVASLPVWRGRYLLLHVFGFFEPSPNWGRISVDYGNRNLQKLGPKMPELQVAVLLSQHLFPLLVYRGYPEVSV
jgi:hypothetical protein